MRAKKVANKKNKKIPHNKRKILFLKILILSIDLKNLKKVHFSVHLMKKVYLPQLILKLSIK